MYLGISELVISFLKMFWVLFFYYPCFSVFSVSRAILYLCSSKMLTNLSNWFRWSQIYLFCSNSKNNKPIHGRILLITATQFAEKNFGCNSCKHRNFIFPLSPDGKWFVKWEYYIHKQETCIKLFQAARPCCSRLVHVWQEIGAQLWGYLFDVTDNLAMNACGDKLWNLIVYLGSSQKIRKGEDSMYS